MRLTEWAGLLALLAGGAFAQGGSAALRQTTITLTTAAAGLGLGVNFLQAAVPGAPYSAQQVIEHTQTLADGTHIVRTPLTALVFRDSQGRIRTEKPVMVGPNAPANVPMMVQIRDVVGRFIYTLDTQNHVAHRAVMTQPPFVPRPAPPPHPAGTRTVVPGTPENPTTIVTEWLGTQMMEGVTVEGERFTRTIPVGAEGNDGPIVTIGDMWYSAELGVVVLDKRLDPRNGEEIVRLTNVVRGEPDPALFQVPADYTIVEDNGSAKITYTIPR